MELDWSSSYKTITAKHDEAYKTIELAIKNEEQEQPQIALLNYKLGISLIDDALSTSISVPDEPSQLIDDEWDRACKLIHKMKRTRGEVLLRVGTLAQQYPDAATNARNTQACGGSEMPTISDGRPRTYAELAEALRSIEFNEFDQQKKNELDLIFACHGVKLYHISSSGECKTAAEDSVLRIINIAEDVDKNIQSSFFLQIIMASEAVAISETSYDNDGTATQHPVQISTEQLATLKANMTSDDRSWIYPLVPGAAPCFRTTYGAFIFPDLQSDEPGSAYGIIVPAEADDMILQILESILHGVIIQSDDGIGDAAAHQRTRRAASTSDVVSGNIVLGASYISRGLIKSSEKVGEFVSYSTPYIMSKLGRSPDDTVYVSPTVRNSVDMAKSATGMAANVAGYVAGKVGTATMALGRFLAPHVQAQGSRLLTHTMGYSDTEAREKMGGALTIAAGAVEGFSTVYTGLEQSAGLLGRSLSDNSVKIIEHKYGLSAGTVAAGTFDTVGNVINLSQNMNFISPRSLAKRTMKNAGKALVEGYRPRIGGGSSNCILAGAMCPDLSEFNKAVVANHNQQPLILL